MFSYTILKRKMKYVNISSIENYSQKYGGIMSTETLSYFLKNNDQRLRLGFQIVCSAPRF